MVLTAEEEKLLHEGIGLILSQWTAMRAAVDNGWGGRDSLEKAERTISSLFDFFIQSKVYPPDYDKLGDILEEGLTELNTVADDGSIDDVSETLLDLYDDCVSGQTQFIGKLRLTNSQKSATVVKVSNGNDQEDDEDDDDDDDDTCMNNDQTTDMMVDTSHHCSTHKPEAMPVDQPKLDDGWTLVPFRKNKGKRN